MTSRTFAEHGPAVAEALAAGASATQAALGVGIAARTVERWLSRGRETPDGPYGSLAACFDTARAERTVEPVDGPVSEALAGYLASLGELTHDLDVRAALARSIARAIDGIGENPSGVALSALPRLAAELADVLGTLGPAGEDNPEAWAARMLAPLMNGAG